MAVIYLVCDYSKSLVLSRVISWMVLKSLSSLQRGLLVESVRARMSMSFLSILPISLSAFLMLCL